jgi:hypothetical protein
MKPIHLWGGRVTGPLPALCGVGQFQFLKQLPFGSAGPCPNDQSPLFGKCFQPVISFEGGGFTASCTPRRFPVQGIGGATIPDGRGYNMQLKNSDGTYVKDDHGEFVRFAAFKLAPRYGCITSDSEQAIRCMAAADPQSLSIHDFSCATAGPSLVRSAGLCPPP